MFSFCQPRTTCHNHIHRDRWESILETVREFYTDLNVFIGRIRNAIRLSGDVNGDPPDYPAGPYDRELNPPTDILVTTVGRGRGEIVGFGRFPGPGIGRGGGFPGFNHDDNDDDDDEYDDDYDDDYDD